MIDSKLDGAYFAVYFRDLNIDLNNYEHPDKHHLGSFFINFGQNYFKSYAIFVKHNELESDTGWLLDDVSIRDFVSVHEHKE